MPRRRLIMPEEGMKYHKAIVSTVRVILVLAMERMSGLTRDGMTPSLSRKTKFSGASGDKKVSLFPLFNGPRAGLANRTSRGPVFCNCDLCVCACVFCGRGCVYLLNCT